MYWFSCAASPCKTAPVDDDTDISNLMGQHLTWAECIKRVGGNPDAYSARSRTIGNLQETVQTQWLDLFGESTVLARDSHD